MVAKRLRTKAEKDRLAQIVIVALVLVVAGAIALEYELRQPRIDPESLCPVAKAPNQIAIVIDKSDKWDADDIVRIHTLLRDTYTSVPAQTRLTIQAITGPGRSSTQIETLFDKCNPGSEQQCSALYENCRRIRKRYEDGFEEQLIKAGRILEQPGESRNSPIFETLSQLLDDAKGDALQILLVSDLMENDKFHFDQTVPLAEDVVREYPLAKGRRVSVHLYIEDRRRYSRKLKDAVLAVWEEYFRIQQIEVSSDQLLIAD